MATEQEWTNYSAAKAAMLRSGLGEFSETLLGGGQNYSHCLYSTLSKTVATDEEVADLALPYVELSLEIKANVRVTPLPSTGRIEIKLAKHFDLTPEEYEQQLALRN